MQRFTDPRPRPSSAGGDGIIECRNVSTGKCQQFINHHAPNGVVTLNIRKVANGQAATTVNATLH